MASICSNCANTYSVSAHLWAGIAGLAAVPILAMFTRGSVPGVSLYFRTAWSIYSLRLAAGFPERRQPATRLPVSYDKSAFSCLEKHRTSMIVEISALAVREGAYVNWRFCRHGHPTK